MSLDDSVFGGSTPDQVATDVASSYQPDAGQPMSGDPADLAMRLARKLSGQQFQGVDFDKVVGKSKKSDDDEEDSDKPDLSSYGTPVAAAPKPSTDDLSSFGKPVGVDTSQPGVIANNAKGFVKSLARGAPEAAGSIMQGTAALTRAQPLSPDAMGLIDDLGNAGSMTASDRAKLMGRALRTIGDRGLQMDFNAALQRIARGGNPQDEADALRNKFGMQNIKAAAPVENTPLYQAGTATKNWIDKTVPMSDAEKNSAGAAVGGGISSIAPYLAAGALVGPEVGLILGAAGMGTQTAGDTFQQAKAKGASDDQAAAAAGWGGAVGAALGTLPLGAVFKPVAQASPGFKAWMAAKLVQAAQSSITFATAGEAQEYLLQQIAKEQYDPKAGYSPDAKRIIGALLTGAIVGPFHPLKEKDLSSPEAIADFIKRAARAGSTTGRTPEEEANFQQGVKTRADIDEFLRQKDQQQAGNLPALPVPEGGAPEAPTGTPPEENPPPTGGEPQAPSTEQAEIEGLKRYGWTDEEIAGMTPAQRRAEFQEAMATGQSEPPASSQNSPETTIPQNGTISPEENAAPSESETNATPGTRDEPIVPETAADVQSAQAQEPTPDQAKAGNYQHAHMELPHLGLTGAHSISIETGAGQIRRGVGEDGKPWEVTMPAAYGRIKGTKGADGEHLDIFVGPEPKSPHVFVIDQHRNDGSGFDEHKIMAGFNTPQEALMTYGRAYNDLGGNRIGHVTAMTPEQFKGWIVGSDTTQPLKRSLSEQEIGNLFDEIVGSASAEEGGGEKGGEPGNTFEESSGSPQLPQVGSDGGPSPQPAGAVNRGESESGNARESEIIAPSKIRAEPTEEHHAQIEAVLGTDYHHVLPVDVARAAEILAENPGITPQVAFQHAVIEDAAAQNFLKPEQLEQAYGPQVKTVLEPGGEGTPSSSPSSEQGGTTTHQEPTTGTKEAGELPGGGETGAPSRTEADQSSAAENGEQSNAAGEQPNPKRKARGSAAEAGTNGTKNANQSSGARLNDYTGVTIPNQEEVGLHGDNDGGPTKRAFLADARGYLQKVAKILADHGFAAFADRKGKPGKPVNVNPAGPAVSGDVSISMRHSDGRAVYANIGTALAGPKGGISLMARKASDADRYGTKSQNQWLPVDLTANELAERLLKIAGEATKTPEPKTTDLLTADDETWEKAIWDALNKAWDNGTLDPKYRRSYRFVDGHIQRYDGKRNGKERWFKQAKFELGNIAQQLGLPSDYDRTKAKSDAEWEAGSLLGDFTERLKGDGFKNILDARRMAKERGVEDLKQVEETLELAAVKAAREIVDTSKDPYPELVSLYEKQPRLGTRTSTSVRDQAYSTPVPLAYVADRLADITEDTTVYEPTAGNGALLLTADPANVRANELNPARAKNLRDQGFEVREGDALTKNTVKRVDRVIANPPFGVVKENGASKIFNLSHIQPGYHTTEIDHAIALHALDAMKDDGKAVLILGGPAKTAKSREARSDAYNGKSKREFYKTLYDHYNVTDHFTVAGELYERQGAGWPVDVIVIEGRGKSARALPAVDVPRIYDNWQSLGGLLEQRAADKGTAGRPAGSSAPEGAELAGGGGPDRGNARPSGPRRTNAAEEQPSGVRAESGAEQPGRAPAGGAGGKEQGRPVRGGRSNGAGEQPPAERSPSRLSADEIGDIFDELVPEESDTRTTPEVAKSAVKNAASAADDAMSALTQLFGGGKTIGMGINFDEDTYAKAKPLFIQAAEKFADFKYDIRELMRRMIDHLKKAYKWTNEMLREARDYFVRFIDDVQSGAVKLLHTEPEKTEQPTAPVEQPKTTTKAAETAGQVSYNPKSKVQGLDTLVPINMRDPIQNALKELEGRVGPIDDFVAKELGVDKRKLPSMLSAEQVDALGLAIDNLNKGKGFIIGDQTGIGKGRVNASIIKWAMNKGRIPIFVTEKPGLYADIVRDILDIGMEAPRILATNGGLNLPLNEAGTLRLKTGDTKSHNAILGRVRSPDEFKKNYDMVATTYNQMQTVKGEDTDRRRFLSSIIPNAVILFDESHNAGGQKVNERFQKKNQTPGRSTFARDLVKRANGVFYSSATYAKRPDVMDLYAATDMAMAVDDLNALGEAIAKGGIPMQQAVAAMLSKAGQYIRRERSFAGINYNTPSAAVEHETYDKISHSLAAIQDFSKLVRRITKDISQDLAGAAQAVGADNAVSDAGASSTNFTSIMHNIINQMLLAMKAPEAARLAVEAIQRGEKPVLTVSNTMESFLSDYANDLGITVGDEIEADFSDVLRKYLDRSRRITIKKPFGEKSEHHVLSDEELGPLALDAYNEAKAIISSMDLSGLAVSPIDYIKNAIEKAGYDVGEITGRGTVVDYSGDKPVLRSRPGSETTPAGKNKTISRFNTRPEKGGTHAVIINQSGSTGISMHSNAKFDDRSKRRMIIVQPEANIDTHMQLLGRVNRTGQVVLPEYDQLVADIPAEKRPTAILAKKMASLNANTTASRTSAVTAKDVPDLMNEYGDRVAVAFVNDNPEMNERLGEPVKQTEGKLNTEDAMRKLTGRLPLLPLKQQEEVWEHLQDEYDSLIKQLEASGTSPLEAKTMDLKARTLETSEVQGRKNDSGSPFAAPVNMEKVSILRQGKPFTPAELIQRLAGNGDMPQPEHFSQWLDDIRAGRVVERQERDAKLKEFNDYIRPIIEKIDDPKAKEVERDKLNTIKDRWEGMHEMLTVGRRVRLNMADGTTVAVVLDVKQPGKQPKNPLALGSWKATFAIPDGSRQQTIPFSRLFEQGKSDPESMLDIEVVPTNETAKDTLARFELMQSGAREERYIATGNLLSAYDWLNMKGNIINYTDAQGAVHQGILTAKDFKLGEHAIKKGRIVTDPAELRTIIDQNQTVWSKDRQVNLSRADRWSDNIQIQAEKKKATGGRYYLDPQLTALTGDFYSRGGMMTTSVPGRDFAAVVKRMQELGAQFTVAAAAPKAQKVEQPPEPPEDEPPGGGGASLASRAALQKVDRGMVDRLNTRQINDLTAKLQNIVRRVAGPGFDIKFNLGLIRGRPTVGYGDTVATDAPAAGIYNQSKALIELALAGNDGAMRTAAYHEAYHALEDKLQTDAEIELMKRETPRLREWIKGKTGLSDAQVDKLAGYEVRAIAFQIYASERDAAQSKAGNGIHIMVRRWFDRLRDLIHKIGNALRGYGLKTARDVFGDAYEGKMAGREHLEGHGIDAKSMAADWRIFRREQDEGVDRSLRDVMGKATLWNKFRERAQDLNEAVKRLEDAVQARMEGELPDSKAFYQKKRLFPGKVATEVQDFNKQHLDPMIDLLKQKGLTLNQVGDILYAQHAPERNDYIDSINPDMEGRGSGMSNEEAQAILDRYTPQDLAEISTRVDGIRDFILDTMVRSGLESRTTTDEWREQYDHYVPLGGFDEPREDDDDGLFRESGKFQVRGKEVRQAFGRSSKANNPLVNLLDQAYRTIERAKKNEYLRSLKLALGGMDPEDREGFVKFDRGKMKREIDPRTGLVRSVADSSYRYSPNAVPYKVGGQTHYMVFDQRAMAEVLRRMHPDALNGIGQSLLAIQNKLKAMWTHWSPEFLPRHFLFRYPIEGTINSFEQGNVPRYMADTIPFIGRASKAIFATNKGIVHPDPDVAQYQRYWQEMRQAGGAMAFRQARDVDLLREHLQKKLASLSGRPLASAKDKWHSAVEAMDTVTNALDNSLRLAAYAEARRQGKTPEQAAVIARDATVDFQQAGSWKNWIGLWYPFGNVAVQTGARMGTAMGRSKVMRRVFAGTVAAGFMTGMFNYLIGGDDKDGIPYYDKFAEWEKHLNVMLANPFHHDSKGRPVPIKIPLPYNWAFPFAIGQAMATIAFSKTRGAARKMIAMATKAGIEAFSPFTQDANFAANLAPELVRPLVHTTTNENWTGYPIHLDQTYQRGPRSESGYRSTGEGWKYSARMLNDVSGGDKHHSGYLDFFPEDLREMFDYYSGLGTQRKFGLNVANSVENAVTGKPVDYSKLPLARVVMGTDYDAADRSRRQENRRIEKRPWER